MGIQKSQKQSASRPLGLDPHALKPLLGKLIHRGLQLRSTLQRLRRRASPEQYQLAELQRLLSTAGDTAFARRYDFGEILASDDPGRAFRARVPVFDYDRMHDEWWHRTFNERTDVTWPGQVPYFALSSGTSGAASKHILVTREMVQAIQRAGIRQIDSLAGFHLPDAMFQKQVLLLGGEHGTSPERGISRGRPQWHQRRSTPGLVSARIPARP